MLFPRFLYIGGNNPISQEAKRRPSSLVFSEVLSTPIHPPPTTVFTLASREPQNV